MRYSALTSFNQLNQHSLPPNMRPQHLQVTRHREIRKITGWPCYQHGKNSTPLRRNLWQCVRLLYARGEFHPFLERTRV